jgi:cell wall-associated NlpC family hydrolase
VLLGSPVGSQLSLGYQGRPHGPVDLGLGATYIGGLDGGRWGLGADLGILRSGPGRWYGTVGMAAGFGTGEAGDWAAWTAGAGRVLNRGSRVQVAIEARYIHLSLPDDAVTLGVRILFGRPATTAPTTSTPPAATVFPARSPEAQAVIQSALDAMGTPYAWGGTDSNGFDCSGLIQYAFGQHGVPLPRRSVDQAQTGGAVPRETEDLLPGDILVFGDAGVVTHVGLYLGQELFIHSATGGVRVSSLRPDDPEGGYWYRRWLWARRVLPTPPAH